MEFTGGGDNFGGRRRRRSRRKSGDEWQYGVRGKPGDSEEQWWKDSKSNGGAERERMAVVTKHRQRVGDSLRPSYPSLESMERPATLLLLLLLLRRIDVWRCRGAAKLRARLAKTGACRRSSSSGSSSSSKSRRKVTRIEIFFAAAAEGSDFYVGAAASSQAKARAKSKLERTL